MRIPLSFLLLLFLFGIALLSQEIVVLLSQEPSPVPMVAPGVLTVIPPDINYESVINRADIPELLAVLPAPSPELQNDVRFDPNAWAKDMRFKREVWCLQFSFKPVRFIDVDIPNAQGNFDKKKIWYLVYNVKNLGPAEVADGKIIAVNSSLGSTVPAGNEITLPVQEDETLEGVQRAAALEVRQQPGIFVPAPGSGKPLRFVPHFVLATHRLALGSVPVENPETGETEWHTERTAVAYDDRVIPPALAKIKEREKTDALETSVSIAQKEIAPGQDVWGAAMWTDVDPRINEFSIFVSGLTNAYQWADAVREDGTYENRGRIGEERTIKRRILKTNWWRTGDQHSLDESQIRFGAREEKIPQNLFDAQANRRMTPDERKKLEEAVKTADTNKDMWVSLTESALYHLIRQDWLQPGFGYEWIFL